MIYLICNLKYNYNITEKIKDIICIKVVYEYMYS